MTEQTIYERQSDSNKTKRLQSKNFCSDTIANSNKRESGTDSEWDLEMAYLID